MNQFLCAPLFPTPTNGTIIHGGHITYYISLCHPEQKASNNNIIPDTMRSGGCDALYYYGAEEVL